MTTSKMKTAGTGAPNPVIADICAATGSSVHEIVGTLLGRIDPPTKETKQLNEAISRGFEYRTVGGYYAGQVSRDEQSAILEAWEKSASGAIKNLAKTMRGAWNSGHKWSESIARFNRRQHEAIILPGYSAKNLIDGRSFGGPNK